MGVLMMMPAMIFRRRIVLSNYVLGALSGTISFENAFNGDLNTFSNQTNSIKVGRASDTATNKPSVFNNEWCYYLLIGNIQVCWRYWGVNDVGIYYRTRNASGSNPWNDWKSIATDIPAFYKNYSTLDALKSALHVGDLQTLATLTDNDVVNAVPGIFVIQPNTQHSPDSNKYFYAFCYGEPTGLRIIIAVETNLSNADAKAFLGALRTDSSGLTWKQITLA